MIEFKKETLENGLTVLAECNGDALSAAVGFFVKTGARDEEDDIAGVSHFLEHMLFKGTPTRTADDVNREFDELGAYYNAFTSEENTVFYAAVLPEYLDQTVALLADIMRPSLREEDFEMEKQVILEEIFMYEDQPPFGADEKARAEFWAGHPLAKSVLGTVETIEALRAEQMRDYFRRRYPPGNVILAATGAVDFDELAHLAATFCGDWEPAATRRPVETPVAHPGFSVLHKEIATQQYSLLMADAPFEEDEDRYAAKLLSTILGDDVGSRLYFEFIETGRADHVGMSHCEFEGAAMYATTLSCSPEITADNLKLIRDVYEAAAREGVSAKELEQAKNKVRSRLVLGSELPRNRVFGLGLEWAVRERYMSMEDEMEALDAITLDRVNAVAAEYPPADSLIMTVGPLEEMEAV